jgi:hypothetical protein
MANITVPGLPAKTGTILDAAYLHLNESSVDKKVTIAQLLAKIEAQYSADIVSFLGSANKAEGRANLSIDRRVTVDNANYTILATDKVVAQIGTMSAARTFSLPAASTVQAGAEIIVIDESGSVDSTNKIIVQRNGTDTIDGLTSFEILQAYGVLILICDGSNSWKIKNNGDVRNLHINNKLNTQPNTATISSGAITYTGAYMVVDTEGGASSDTLDTINGGTAGDKLLLRGAASGRNIIISDNTGNIQTNNNTNFTLEATHLDSAEFYYDGSNWVQTARRLDSDFQNSKNTNGYTYLPNGIIIQWGRNNVTSGSVVTLPITMSNYFSSNTHHYGVVPSIGTSAVGTTSNITLYHTQGGSVDIEWLVIGSV